MSEDLVVPFAPYSIEDPWAVPEGCERVTLRRAADGLPSRLRTTAALYHDDRMLTAVFDGVDDGVRATHFDHDAPLYEEDVVELFLAPEDPRVYFEVEVNPLGTTFDAKISSPDGVRATMRTDLTWNCAGMLAAVRREPSRLAIVVRLPFVSLGRKAPADGETWGANLFRIDRHPERGDEFMAWRPTMKTPADFHVAAAFGTLQFRRRARR